MRIFIADIDGGYRPESRFPDWFVDGLTSRIGARSTVRVQWPEPGARGTSRPHTWESAAAAGAADLNRLIRLHPSDDIVLIGGGCGTRVIHDWLDAHPVMHDRIAAVGLIGDPYRPAGRALPGQPDPGGQGVAGSREGPLAEDTFWLSVPGDPLSGVESDSVLRGTVRESDLTPAQVYDHLLVDIPDARARLAARLGIGHRPEQWSPSLLRRVADAREVLRRHETGAHIEAYENGESGGWSPLEMLIRAIGDHVSDDGGYTAPRVPLQLVLPVGLDESRRVHVADRPHPAVGAQALGRRHPVDVE